MINLQVLGAELDILRQHLRQAAIKPEHDATVGAIAEAGMAAKAGDGPKAVE